MDALSATSNFFQIATYVGGPILLGLLILYGMRNSWGRKTRRIEEAQNEAVRRNYGAEEKDRSRRERDAQQSSQPSQIIERKTGTTS